MFAAFAVGLGLTANLWAQVPSYVPTNGLVGWWPFNGNANDESGNGNNGTVNGATLTTDRFGNASKAYSFDGVNDFIATNYPGILGFSDRSVSFWAKQSQTGTSLGNQVVLGWGGNVCGPSGIGTGFYCSFNVGALGSSIDGNESAVTYNTNSPVNDDNWHHYVFIKDQSFVSTSGVKIYQDGILLNQVNYSYISTANLNTLAQTNLTFGKKTFSCVPDRFFQGVSDEIGIWNRVLTNQEITALYNGCGNEISSQPSNANSIIGSNAQFNVLASSGSTYQWQSNPLNLGWQNINNNSSYSGATSITLTVSNTSVSNHNQPYRVIVNAGGCIDTSDVATIQMTDTCITNLTVYDTLLTTVTDTLIISTTLSLPAPNNENTILIYPNPASDHITIDNGNFTAMAGYSIRIENNAGQQVFLSAINQAQFYVDLSTWTGNGLYFVHLIDPQNNTVTVRKIVLQ